MTRYIVFYHFTRSDEENVSHYKSLKDAVCDLRDLKVEIEWAFEVSPGLTFGRPHATNATRDLESTWLEIERAELEEEYYRTNPKMSLEEYLDQAVGPRYRKPSVRKPEHVVAGFGVKQMIAEAAE
jgi:hypothetical protein